MRREKESSLTPMSVLRVLLMVFFGIAILFAWFSLSFSTTSASYSQSFENLMTALPILIALMLWFCAFLRKERTIRFLVSYCLFFVVLIGLLAVLGSSDLPFGAFCRNFMAGISVGLILFWCFNRLPGLMIGVVICSIGGLILFIICLSVLIGNGSGIQGIMTNPLTYIFLGCFIASCAYFPRNLEIRRYLFPFSGRVSDPSDSFSNDGFTLIEILIAVAVLGILSYGMVHSWSYCIRCQKELALRVQMGEILDSQMHFIMAADTVFAPSNKSYELPIPLTEFKLHVPVSGKYYVMKTEDSNLLKITILLEHDAGVGSEFNRCYRLVGFRHCKEDSQ